MEKKMEDYDNVSELSRLINEHLRHLLRITDTLGKSLAQKKVQEKITNGELTNLNELECPDMIELSCKIGDEIIRNIRIVEEKMDSNVLTMESLVKSYVRNFIRITDTFGNELAQKKVQEKIANGELTDLNELKYVDMIPISCKIGGEIVRNALAEMTGSNLQSMWPNCK